MANNTFISEDQLDIITELVHIGIGRAAHVLSQMTSHRVHIFSNHVKSIECSSEENDFQVNATNCSGIMMTFKGAIEGTSCTIFSESSAAKLVGILLAEDQSNEEMDALRSSTLTEVGSIVLNCVLGTIVNLLKTRLEYTLPTYIEGEINTIKNVMLGESTLNALIANTNFSIKENSITGQIIIGFKSANFDTLLMHIDALNIGVGQ